MSLEIWKGECQYEQNEHLQLKKIFILADWLQ